MPSTSPGPHPSISRRRLLGLIGLGVAVVGLSAACQSAAPAAPLQPTAAPAGATAKPTQPAATSAAVAAGRGGTVKAGQTLNFTSMDPHQSRSGGDRQVYYLLYNTLVAIAPDLSIQPELAEKWDTPDDKTFVFSLRKGVKFHDGTDFNAEAVKFNLDRLLDKSNNSPVAAQVAEIAAAEVVDASTVRLRLSRPSAPLLSALTDRPGFMISPTAAKAAGPDYASKPVGTGPFKFGEYVPDSHVLLTRFDGYWEKDLPAADTVRYEVRTDESVRMADLRSGNLDVVDVVPPKDVTGLKSASDLQLVQGQGLVKDCIIFQCSKPPFDNPALRQALRLSIDLDAVNKAAFLGTAAASRQTSFIPGSFWYDESRTLAKRDIAAAKQKLAEGGQPGGFTFTANIINVGTDLQMFQIYKQQLAEAGITMDIQPLETGSYVDKFLKGDFQATRVGGYGRPDPDEFLRYFLYSKGRYGPGVAWNNAEFDKLLDQGASTYNRDERKKAYTSAEAIVDREVPIIFAIHEQVNIGASKKVQNLAPYPDGLLRLKSVRVG